MTLTILPKEIRREICLEGGNGPGKDFLCLYKKRKDEEKLLLSVFRFATGM